VQKSTFAYHPEADENLSNPEDCTDTDLVVIDGTNVTQPGIDA
jgi:hypothetical protein